MGFGKLPAILELGLHADYLARPQGFLYPDGTERGRHGPNPSLKKAPFHAVPPNAQGRRLLEENVFHALFLFGTAQDRHVHPGAGFS